MPPSPATKNEDLFQVVPGQVNRELGDEGRAAPVRSKSARIDRCERAVEPRILSARECVAVTLVQIGVEVAAVKDFERDVPPSLKPTSDFTFGATRTKRGKCLRQRDRLLRVSDLSDLKELTPLRRAEDLGCYEETFRHAPAGVGRLTQQEGRDTGECPGPRIRIQWG